ncbi:MAG: MATE family efflux transporter [Lentisphaeria bacterium]|nr:MATE family efflux transporter [Lentisphaeria bacterium]
MAKITGFKSRESYEVDMCHGPLVRQMIRFSIPLMISGMLQLLFHAADLIVIGRFSSHEALAAIGATGSLTSLLVNVFIGLSVGTNVLVARYLGEKNRKETSRTVHTAVMSSFAGGIFLAIFGIMAARPVLSWMSTPPEILDKAVLYMSIYFAGMPVIMFYNFGSAIMQAFGDTTRPFYFLLLAGVINVLLNLFFVIVFHWDVAGVAAATVISQAVSAVLVLRVLKDMRGPCRVKWQALCVKWKNLREILWIGVPAGFQSSCFSISNVLIQSSLNTFGSAAMAGNIAWSSVENFGHSAINAVAQTVISFVSRNYGGRQYDRIKKVIRYALAGSCCIVFLWSVPMLIFSGPVLSIFNTNAEVIRWGILRAYCVVPFFFIAAVMQVNTGAMRGLGHSVEPSLISIFCICILRIIWLFTIFRWHPTMTVLLIGYPVTWAFNAAGVSWLLQITLRKIIPVVSHSPRENGSNG